MYFVKGISAIGSVAGFLSDRTLSHVNYIPASHRSDGHFGEATRSYRTKVMDVIKCRYWNWFSALTEPPSFSVCLFLFVASLSGQNHSLASFVMHSIDSHQQSSVSDYSENESRRETNFGSSTLSPSHRLPHPLFLFATSRSESHVKNPIVRYFYHESTIRLILNLTRD